MTLKTLQSLIFIIESISFIHKLAGGGGGRASATLPAIHNDLQGVGETTLQQDRFDGSQWRNLSLKIIKAALMIVRQQCESVIDDDGTFFV